MQLEHVLATKGDGVETITPDATIADLVAKLADLKIGALVVSTDGDQVEGIVSERDIVKNLRRMGPGFLDSPVSEIMTPTVQCAPLTAKTSDLMELMTNSRIRHVPVLNDEHKLIGIVSIGDVVKSRLGELEHERDVLVQYVTVGG
jgi:CBS domain-containing protein